MADEEIQKWQSLQDKIASLPEPAENDDKAMFQWAKKFVHDRVDALRSDKERQLVLRIYQLEGNPDEVLLNSLSFDTNGQAIRAELTRAEYSAFLDRVRTDEPLLSTLMTEFRAESLNYLAGADEPLQRGYPSWQGVYHHFMQSVAQESHALFVSMNNNALCQLFHLSASESDYEGLGNVSVEVVEPKVHDFSKAIEVHRNRT